MLWSEIRKAYPDQWLIVEAIEARTTINNQRQLEKLTIIEQCADGKEAFRNYRHLHQQFPQREFYFLHTSREEPDIHEQQWLGIRRVNEAHSDR
jgi:hypothetical protein